MSTLSPNMNLTLSTIAVDSGLQWEQNLNASLTILDGHTHASGSGVQIQPNGLNINTDLPFNSNNATLLRSTRYVSQTSALAVATDLGCISNIAGNLYWNNNGGTAVQITSGTSIVGAAGTISGLPSGTAAATFSTDTFVFTAATDTPANIKGASVLLGNNVASSNYITLSPPNAIASSYALKLPALPASSLFVTLDTSGNFGTATNIQGTQIASASLTGAQLAAATITGSNIALVTITGANLVNATITGSKIAATTVSGSNMVNATITATQISNSINLPVTPQGGGKNLVVSNSNTTNALAVVRCYFNADGTVAVGEGISCGSTSTGVYNLVFGQAFNDAPAVTVTPIGSALAGVAFTPSTTGCTIKFYTLDSFQTLTDTPFYIQVIGQRT